METTSNSRIKRFVTSEFGKVAMSLALASLLILLVASLGRSQETQPKVPAPDTPPQVDMGEIARWGDRVQHVDGSIRDDMGETMADDALGLPPDDNHKWFITVIGTKGCPACSRLRADIKADQTVQKNLGAFITLADNDDRHSSTKTGWSHYHYMLAEDASQAPFIKAVGAKSFPTIVVQTPINGKYGPKGVIVYQRAGYDGDADKLAKSISDAIRLYVAKLAEKRQAIAGPIKQMQPPPPVYASDEPPPRVVASTGQRTPPFTPPPQNDPVPLPSPFNPPVNPLDPLPPQFQIPPPVAPATPVAPKPATPNTPPDTKPVDPALSTTPEAVVVYDKNVVTSADKERFVKRITDKLLEEGRVLRVRPVDYRDVPSLDLPKDQLPAVIVTAEGRVIDRITDRLLPIVAPEPQAPAPITLADIPWSVLISMVLGGGITIPGVIAIGMFVLKLFRQWRASQGKAPLIPVSDERIAEIVTSILTKLGVTPAAPPSNVPKS